MTESRFTILSLPRSGSHMLASALDSHPEICCEGEYTMVEKFPIGRTPGLISGCITQAYHIECDVTPPWIDEAKLILLYRPINEIAMSLYYDSKTGTSFKQHLEPTERDKPRYIVDERKLAKLREQQDLLTAYARGRGGFLYLTYEWLTKGMDTRALPVYAERVVCEFLGVNRHPLIPSTYKPS